MAKASTITRFELSEAAFYALGLSRSDSSTMIDAVFDEISQSLEEGEAVKVSGFGTFALRDKKERVGRNPKTGEEVPITPRRVVCFKASALLKNALSVSSSPAPKGGKVSIEKSSRLMVA